MNWDQVEGKWWKDFSGKFQAQWGKFAANLDVIKGQLENDLQKRNEFAAEKAKSEVDPKSSNLK